MNSGQERTRNPQEELFERCRELSLPVWRLDSSGRVIATPQGWGVLEPWFASPALQEMIAAARSEWPPTTPPPMCELRPGLWLLPLIETAFDERHCVGAALALGTRFLESPKFTTICLSAAADEVIMRAALSSIAIYTRESVENISRVLDWMTTDLLDAAQNEHAIEKFSEQLVDTYEQMSLLYRIAESMNGLEDPPAFISLACNLLLSTLDFKWIAVRFTSLRTLGRGLSNELILAGEIPCSHTRYDRLAGAVTMMADIADRWTVLDPQSNDLAKLVGSEVFVNPLACKNDLAGVLIAGNKSGDDPDISTVDMQLLSATADYLTAFVHNSSLYNEQRTMFLGIVRALSASIDAKDRYTRGHSERVAHLATELALAMGYTDDQAERVRLAGILHDMGKIGVPEAVLLKPGRLTEQEFSAIKRHPSIGYNILKDIEPLEDVLPGVLYHHERWDGKGYPHGLRGEKIPLLGRILAVADAFDAMSSDRAYRPRIAREKVLMEMRNGAGSQFDGDLVEIFLTLDLSKYDAMIDRHAAQSQAHAA